MKREEVHQVIDDMRIKDLKKQLSFERQRSKILVECLRKLIEENCDIETVKIALKKYKEGK